MMSRYGKMRFRVYLCNGRNNPSINVGDWGFGGPSLYRCVGFHQTYGGDVNLIFATKADAEAAQKLTGWFSWDDNCLTVRWHKHLVVTTTTDGTKLYFADWGMIPEDADPNAGRGRS